MNLENFFRLWICGVPSLPLSDNDTFTLSFQNTSGNPAVNLYWSCETNGGIGYLTDTNIAALQTMDISGSGYGVSIGTVSNNSSYMFPAGTFQFGGTQHLLFEGAGVGSGELVLTIADTNGNTIAQTGVWLDLHDIKDFYERAAIAEDTSGAISNWSSTIDMQQQAIANLTGNDTNIIVFVHGFLVGNWDWLDDSDTILKRLYWAGYQGKFASVKWPCETSPLFFDSSELYAYKASGAMATYLSELRTRFPNYQLNIFAHSQGNAVIGEAIEEGAPFDNYIMTQAAMPANSYDVDAPVDSDLLNQETFFPTPNLQPMGYLGLYTNINLTGRIVNFYNTNDYALETGTTLGLPTNWKEDQKLKPDAPYSSDGTYVWDDGAPVTDPEEARAFAARSRTDAVGATAGLAGVISSSIDLNAQFQFGRALADHSAQWTWPIQTSRPYYLQVINSLNP